MSLIVDILYLPLTFDFIRQALIISILVAIPTALLSWVFVG
ncbi:hypothetical protein [Agrobacterium tumefaciens]